MSDKTDTLYDGEKSMEPPTASVVTERTAALPSASRYVTGWNLHAIMTSIQLLMFVAQMESTITSASVITITDDLGGFIQSSWILTAYWLTAGAFQIIWAKLSDLLGRKRCIIAAIAIFTTFSGACGGSQTVIQLIMFRWIQGIGGCGILALRQLLVFELVSPEKYPQYIAATSAIVASAVVVGPLIGGGITVSGDWRWIFLFNVPVGAVAAGLILWLFPAKLFNEPVARRGSISWKSIRRLDLLGCFLLVGFCLFLTAALQQAAVRYAFTSAFVLPLLVFVGPFLVAFLVWQWFITMKRSTPEPMFPWRFCQDRVQLAMMLVSLTNGGIVSTCVVQIPQRYMTVNGMSSIKASAQFLALGAFVPIGTAFSVVLTSRLKIRSYIVVGAAVLLQIIGAAFLARASTDYRVQQSQYGMQVLVGTGVGLIIGTVLSMIPENMQEQDVAVATATQSQFRLLGGAIAVSIGATITTRYLKNELLNFLPGEVVGLLLERTEAIQMLSPKDLARAREFFGKAYNRQMYIAIALAAVQLPLALMMWKRHVPDNQKPRRGGES